MSLKELIDLFSIKPLDGTISPLSNSPSTATESTFNNNTTAFSPPAGSVLPSSAFTHIQGIHNSAGYSDSGTGTESDSSMDLSQSHRSDSDSPLNILHQNMLLADFFLLCESPEQHEFR